MYCYTKPNYTQRDRQTDETKYIISRMTGSW